MGEDEARLVARQIINQLSAMGCVIQVNGNGDKPSTRMIPIEAAAKRVHCTVSVLRRMLRSSKLPPDMAVKLGNRWMFRVPVLDAWVMGRGQG